MPLPCFRATLILSLCTLSPVAWAGGTGSTGGSSGGTGTVATGDTGGTSGTDTGGTTGEGSSSSGECGECTPVDDPVQIVIPVDGAVLPRTFDVQVTAPYTCNCDDITMCCSTLDPASVTLQIDGMTYQACNTGDCDTTDHTFTVENLAPGEHTLRAVAPVNLMPQFSAEVMITVEGELLTGDTTAGGEGPPPTTMTAGNGTTSSGGSSSGGPASSDGGGGGGCGCHTDGDSPGSLALGIGLLLLGAARRRRP